MKLSRLKATRRISYSAYNLARTLNGMNRRRKSQLARCRPHPQGDYSPRREGLSRTTLPPTQEFHHTILLRLDRKGRQAPGGPALTSIRTPLRLGSNHSMGT